MDKNSQTIVVITENIIGATPDNYARSFLSDLPDHLRLDQKDLIGNGQLLTCHIKIIKKTDCLFPLHPFDEIFANRFLQSQLISSIIKGILNPGQLLSINLPPEPYSRAMVTI